MEAFHHLATGGLHVGQERCEVRPSMLGPAAHHVDALRCEHGEGQRFGQFRARAGSLSIHQHALGGVTYTAGQGEVDLYAAGSLEDHPVDLGGTFARPDHVARGAGAKRRRRRQSVDRF